MVWGSFRQSFEQSNPQLKSEEPYLEEWPSWFMALASKTSGCKKPRGFKSLLFLCACSLCLSLVLVLFVEG
jgi:hypothetical protein